MIKVASSVYPYRQTRALWTCFKTLKFNEKSPICKALLDNETHIKSLRKENIMLTMMRVLIDLCLMTTNKG